MLIQYRHGWRWFTQQRCFCTAKTRVQKLTRMSIQNAHGWARNKTEASLCNKLAVKQCTGRTLLDTMTLQNIKSSAMVKSSNLFLIHASTPNYRRRRYKNRNKMEKFLQLFFPHSWRIKPATNEVSNTKRFGIGSSRTQKKPPPKPELCPS